MEQGKLTYLLLILIWAVPLIGVQWLIGGDLFLRRWKLLIPAVLVPTAYLIVVDSIALGARTWAINPNQSLGIFLPFPSNVPLEEFIFFLVTNTLIVQGMILVRNGRLIVRRVLGVLRFIRRGPKAADEAK